MLWVRGAMARLAVQISNIPVSIHSHPPVGVASRFYVGGGGKSRGGGGSEAFSVSQYGRKRVNRHIHAPYVTLMDAEGRPLGNFSTGEALQKAEESGCDLVEVDERKTPPVCRMFPRMTEKQVREMKRQRMEEEASRKKAQEQETALGRRGSKVIVDGKRVKEMWFSSKIAEHDVITKTNRIARFLASGHITKVTVKFKREVLDKPLGTAMLQNIHDRVEPLVIEPWGKVKVRSGARDLFMTLTPRPDARDVMMDLLSSSSGTDEEYEGGDRRLGRTNIDDDHDDDDIDDDGDDDGDDHGGDDGDDGKGRNTGGGSSSTPPSSSSSSEGAPIQPSI